MESLSFIPDNYIENSYNSKYYTPQEFNNMFDSNPNDISLLHANLRSLNRNFEYFENLLHTLNNFKFSVIGISETWLHENSPDLFNLPNYKLIRADRKGKRGGGVAFYIAEKLKFKIRSDVKLLHAETLFIEIENTGFKNIIIGLIYRPPGSNFDLFYKELEQYLYIIGNENKHTFILGDFNINFLPSVVNNNSNNFMKLMYSFGFHSFINKSTRINPYSSTQIDNIFSNVHNNMNNKMIGGILCSEVSDHLPIFLTCELKLPCPKSFNQRTYRKESKRNIELMKQDLLIEGWEDVYNEADANISYNLLNNKLQHYYEKNIPIGKVKNNRKNPNILG